MARKAREKSKTGIYNIILKSSEVLFKTKEDYDFFVEIMKEYICEIHAYALTPAYVCIVAKESEKGIGLDMKPLITKYARYYNRTYQNEGKIFEDRFKSEPIEDEAELKNSVALVSNITVLFGDGVASAKPAKKYEMISFYAKLTGEEAPKTQKVQKTPKPKKTTAPKKKAPTPEKKPTPKAKPVQESKPTTKAKTVQESKPAPKAKPEENKPQTINSEQQRKKLPTWLL